MDINTEFNRSLELTIMPTEQCDCRCVYCPEKFEIGRMSGETVSALKKFIGIRVPELTNLSISWFGGEPLVGYPIILNIMEHVNSIKNKNTVLTSNATTNGRRLTLDKLQALTDLGVGSYQISFDGDKEEHDKLRITVDHRGTFDAIWGNILDAHRSRIRFNTTIRLHVNKNNEQSMERMLRKISVELEKDERFMIFIRPLSRLGSQNDTNLPIVEDKASVTRLKSFAMGLGLKVIRDDDNVICYAAKPNAYVIRADGTLSKCTVKLYEDYNIIGRLNPDGTLNIDANKVMLWSRGIISGDKKELSCPAKNFPQDESKNGMKLKILNNG